MRLELEYMIRVTKNKMFMTITDIAHSSDRKVEAKYLSAVQVIAT